jgi:hypothetical protein
MDFKFKKDMEVVNPVRPEWGIGKVLSTEPGSDSTSQRVRVSFPGAGVKTMMIPPGQLVQPENQVKPDVQVSESGDNEALGERLQAIPQVVNDCRESLEVRLAALVKLYKFSDDRRDIFDWAVVQLGHRDPLGSFSADELGLYFSNFSRSRDRALLSIYNQACQKGLKDRFMAELTGRASEKICQRMCQVLVQG